jgi:hypothetical protein
VHSSIRFSTYSLPCFNFLHGLFYPDGTKIIPQNIAELIKPIGLAFWLMDDGYWNQVGRYVVLCTDPFFSGDRCLATAQSSCAGLLQPPQGRFICDKSIAGEVGLVKKGK